jgi:hypothetical protein
LVGQPKRQQERRRAVTNTTETTHETQGVLTFDPARYLDDVAELDLPEPAKIELLTVLFYIMRRMVDLGFDVGNVDFCGLIRAAFDAAANPAADAVNSEHSATNGEAKPGKERRP